MNVSSGVCAHCGLPLARYARIEDNLAHFCCYGCEVAYDVLGAPGEEASGRLTMYKLWIGVILGINVMMFSMPLYVDSLADFLRSGPGAAHYFELLKYLLLALSTPVYLLLGLPYLDSAWAAVRSSRGWRITFSTDLLIAIGVTAAYLLSAANTVIGTGPVYYETAVAILVIVTAGRYLEARTRARASRELATLTSSIPAFAERLDEVGVIEKVEVSKLKAGDLILVRPGDMLPVDGTIKHGSASVDESMRTGEMTPVLRAQGDELLAGAKNLDGLLTFKVSCPVGESFVARMEELLERAKLSKSHVQEIADRVSEIAVPIILLIALGAGIYWSVTAGFSKGLFTALSVLLIACPCALGIATPAALWISVSQAAKRGVLFRSLAALERLAKVKTAFFDKTGTLTIGDLIVVGVDIEQSALQRHFDGSEERLLTMLNAIEQGSTHPIARALTRALPVNGVKRSEVEHFKEFPGFGLEARLREKTFRVGRRGFAMSDAGSTIDVAEAGVDSGVWCSIERDSGGHDLVCVLRLHDTIRPDAKRAIASMGELGVRCVILSGDRAASVQELAKSIRAEYFGELSPEQKVERVRSEPNSLFIGDGLNDAAAIAGASVGIAMATGADISRANADVTLVEPRLVRVPDLIQLARRTMRIVHQNLAWAFGYNIIGVVFAAMGLLNPILSALAMALSSLFVVQNSLRLKRAFNWEGMADD